MSASSGASRGSEPKTRSATFSLSRLFPSRNRKSKSRLSLDSERSDGGACGISPPHSTGNATRASPPPSLRSFRQFGSNPATVHLPGAAKASRSETHHSTEGISVTRVVVEEDQPRPTLRDCGHVIATDDKGAAVMECPVCLVEKSKDSFLEISTCHHRCCSKCLQEYFRIEIMESRLAIACPECSELFHPNDIRAIVQDNALMQKYENFMLRRVLAMDSDTRWCPAPDCGYAVIATGCAGCPKLKCEREGCDTYFCYHCKQYWHPNQTCDAARAERSPNIRSASVSYSQESGAQNQKSKESASMAPLGWMQARSPPALRLKHHFSRRDEIKSCPRCGAFIVKMDDGSCNHMTCAVCGAGFCWLCMKEISDLHYLSPSGCTFWGRKPWSRKKKILWQLGTLVGAPVGITLVAGIAVPAMIIGIPVWIGRKIHFRYHSASKHRRNLAVTGGVAASILAAPIIAGLAVGIGVPILLAYVYGVVPFSLCRSGGCGVTTTNTGGVRFEFDEHEENNTQGPYSYTGDNHSIETAPNVANPSIAPSIGDASLGMTNSLSASGSHMDRAGVLRDDSDRDSSSHRAIAGNSINGSLCSATYTSQHHKLEVQADISEHAVHCERSSVGGESYSMSLNDDASTKALAGSIISPKDKDGISLCSRHFDGAVGAMACSDETHGKKDDECLSSSSNGGQPKGSSSCPTSPHLRKASPAPSEDARSTRSKKCTRFMDQVSEIESKSDCLSIGSITSNCSTTPPAGEGVCTTVPAYSTLSLTTTTTTTHAALASCESLMSDGKMDTMGSVDMGRQFNLSSCGRLKAESTSVLMDGADSRRCEMGGARRKSDTASRDDLNPSDRSFYRKRGSISDKEHRSQPGNLSDISEIKGMPSLHAAGCSDLLAVIDTSCENVFLDKTGQMKSRLVSASSSCSSSDDPADFVVPRSYSLGDRVILEPCATVEEDEDLECAGSLSDTACSLSDVKMHDHRPDDRPEDPGQCRRKSSVPLASPTEERSFKGKPQHKGKTKLGETSPWSSLSQDAGKSDPEGDQLYLCKGDLCVSRTSIGSDPSSGPSPLPDVEMPTGCMEGAGKVSVSAKPNETHGITSSCHGPVSARLPSTTKASEPVATISPGCQSSTTNKAPLSITFPSTASETAVASKALTNETLPRVATTSSCGSPSTMSAGVTSPSLKYHPTSVLQYPSKGTNRTDPSLRHAGSGGGTGKLHGQLTYPVSETQPSLALASQHSSQPHATKDNSHIREKKRPGCLYTDL